MTELLMPAASTPVQGDVLVSRPTARADVYQISVIPEPAQMVIPRRQDAMELARRRARELAVDGWFTCDHTHFARVAQHRRQG